MKGSPVQQTARVVQSQSQVLVRVQSLVQGGRKYQTLVQSLVVLLLRLSPLVLLLPAAYGSRSTSLGPEAATLATCINARSTVESTDGVDAGPGSSTGSGSTIGSAAGTGRRNVTPTSTGVPALVGSEPVYDAYAYAYLDATGSNSIHGMGLDPLPSPLLSLLLDLLLMVLMVVLLELLTLVLLVVGLDMDLAYESKNLDP